MSEKGGPSLRLTIHVWSPDVLSDIREHFQLQCLLVSQLIDNTGLTGSGVFLVTFELDKHVIMCDTPGRSGYGGPSLRTTG